MRTVVKWIVTCCRFEMRPGLGVGRSPPRGGMDAEGENQQFVVADMDSSEGRGLALHPALHAAPYLGD